MPTQDEWKRFEVALGNTVTDADKAEFECPNWDNERRGVMANWFYFVPEFARERWDVMGEDGRICIYLMARIALDEYLRNPAFDE